MQPTLHMSEAWSYYFSTMEISGALYHLEPTWEERHLFFSLRDCLLFSILETITYLSCSSVYFSVKCCCPILSLILLELPLPWPMQVSGSVREIPKSHSLMLHSSSIRMFPGFKSRWMMLAACKFFTAQSRLYVTRIK